MVMIKFCKIPDSRHAAVCTNVFSLHLFDDVSCSYIYTFALVTKIFIKYIYK